MSVFSQQAKNKTDFSIAPAGAHAGCFIAIIDLGTHTETFQGSDPRDVRKVFILWELDCESEGGNGRCVIGREYNATLAPKSGLRTMIEKLRGKPFEDGENYDLRKLLGKPCLVTVAHVTRNDRTFAKIDAIGPLPKGIQAIKPSRELIEFDLDSGQPFPDADYLPWSLGMPLREKFELCHERRGRNSGAAAANDNANKASANSEPEIDF